MAQFYKMTLYVCDLEDDLSLNEIKMLIDERALSGVSVNAICRFSNEQTGKQIEWQLMLILINWIALYPLGKVFRFRNRLRRNSYV